MSISIPFNNNCPGQAKEVWEYECQYTGHVEEDVVLFTGNDRSDLIILVSEAIDSILLDSACSSAVAGKLWMEDCIASMDEHTRKEVQEFKSSKLFHFGGGESRRSLGVEFPCVLSGKKVRIRSDVVDSPIPLLLSNKAMERCRLIWDFGKEVTLDQTSSGHHLH